MLRPKSENNSDYNKMPRQKKGKVNRQAIAPIATPATKIGFLDRIRAKKEPKKTSVRLNADSVLTPTKKETFYAEAKKVESYRPGEVVESSANGSPLVLKTPDHGTRLPRTGTNGVLSFFAEQTSPQPSPLKKIDAMDPEHKFFETSPFKKVKPNSQIKYQAVLITPELIQKADAEIKANHGRRIRSQNQIMGGSANQYAKATEVFPEELKWEWVHFIAHRILANLSQDEKNLGCGTYHVNTEMMFIECQLPHLAECFKNGFWLKVQPYFIPGTQILTKIEYTIATDEFMLPFVFDAQASKKPDLSQKKYIGALMTSLLKLRDGSVAKADNTVPKALDFSTLKAM